MIGRILGYADKISVCPGDEIAFKVSTDGPERYDARLVRLLCATDTPSGPGYREEAVKTSIDGSYPGIHQPIRAGSHIEVPGHPRLFALGAFTLACALWPTAPTKGTQGLIGTWSPDGGGFMLMIDDEGRLALRLACADGYRDLTAGITLLSRTWYLALASHDTVSGATDLTVVPCPQSPSPQRPVSARATIEGAMPGGSQGLLMAAAHGAGGEIVWHYNGKLEAPRLLDGSLAEVDVHGLVEAVSPIDGAVGWWDFSEAIPTRNIVDRSGNGLDGQTVNLPARAMKGHLWDGTAMSWRYRPAHYGAIHFHDDDLDDCRWQTSFTLTVPDDVRSGCYAAKLTAGDDEDYVPFYVRAKRQGPHADIVYLASTASYTIYGNYHKQTYSGHSEVMNSGFTVLMPHHIYLSRHPELAGSTYDWHTDASGVAYATRLRPVLDWRPKTGLWHYDVDSLIVDWLDRSGLAFDVLTDEDLHLDGLEALVPYRLIVTGHHPEYYSSDMLDALNAFTQEGGRLMYMGGNGFYWRIAFDPDNPAIVEVRRSEGGIRAWAAEPGEAYHSFTGEYGGLWRRAGVAPNRLAGVGFTAQGFDASSYYRLTDHADDPRAAFIVEGIDGDIVGDFGLFGGGASGVEIDRYDADLGSPPHALVIARSEAHSPGMFRVPEEMLATHNMIDGTTNPLVRADLVFFETAGGGAVFSVGSMAWVGALPHSGYDNNVALMSTNVLHRFAAPEPFVMPGADRLGGWRRQEREPGSDGVVEGMGYRP